PISPTPPSVASPAAREKSDSPARVVLPPLSERNQNRQPVRREPPAPPREAERPARREVPARPRDDDRYARRETSTRSREELYARREAASRSREDRPIRRDYGRVEPPARPGARRSFASFVPTGDENLDEFLMQLELEPANYSMAISLARLCAQTGRTDLMSYSYRYLIRSSPALEEVAEEIQDLIGTVDDPATSSQLYRMLGDTFSKQGRLRDAIAAYNHTFGG
ncbi:MAG: hypothetical protein HGA65_09035, partial [Oscillochloris sp.]|nr:hypothetical protein [Oscillochloris sp.]